MSQVGSGSRSLHLHRKGCNLVVRAHGSEGQLDSADRDAVLEAPCWYLFLQRDVPALDASDATDPAEIIAESAIATAGGGSRRHKQGDQIQSRYPHLKLGLVYGEEEWLAVPDGMRLPASLWLHPTIDILDLLGRGVDFAGTEVTCSGAGIPRELFAACVRARGGAGAESQEEVEGVKGHSAFRLLYRPNREELSNAIADVPDGSVIFVFNPDDSERAFDFYRDVHRRGLWIVHGTSKPGGDPEEAKRLLSALPMESLSVPTLDISLSDVIERVVEMPLPESSEAFVLHVRE